MQANVKKKKTEEKVGLIINGELIERIVDSDLTLLRFLRDELGLTGTKEGCGQGHCGTCTVIVDDKAVRSCLQKVSKLNGEKIETKIRVDLTVQRVSLRWLRYPSLLQ